MSVSVVDNRRQAVARADNAGRLGLAAAVTVLKNAVVNEFGSSYYLGGRFRSTLFVKQSVRFLTPYKTPAGYETILGTKLIKALYWEVGHNNLFTGDREQVRIWKPAGDASSAAMQDAYNRIMVRLMGAA